MSVQPTRQEGPEIPRPDRETFAPTPDGALYVRVNGDLDSGAAPVLMIHGGPGGHHGAHVTCLDLAADRAVILYDQLDCGRSDHPGDPALWSVARFAQEIEAVRRHLCVDRLHLLGHSWGAALALDHAVRRPETVCSLILASPYVSTRSWEASTSALLADFPASVRDALWAPRSASPEALRAAMGAFYARHWMRSRPSNAVKAYAADLPFNDALYGALWGATEARVDGALQVYDAERLLGRLAVPTLLVAGEHDEMSPAACRQLADGLPGAETAVVAGAGHMLQIDNPQDYVAILRRWLAARD